MDVILKRLEEERIVRREILDQGDRPQIDERTT